MEIMLKRATPPDIRPVSSVPTFSAVEKIQLPNGLTVHCIKNNAIDIVRIDFMFGCGIWNQTRSLVASFTADMLQEGTPSLSSKNIAEQLDFYGSWLQLSSGYHNSYLTAYSLSKFTSETLSIVEQIVKNSIFPEVQFEIYRNHRLQEFLLNSKRVQYLANRCFSASVYGSNHPYGKTATEDDFSTIAPQHLRDFYDKYYHAGNCRIIITGKITNEILKEIERKFGSSDWLKASDKEELSFPLLPDNEKKRHVERSEAVQSAIYIGRASVNNRHEDFKGLKVLMTVLGGYFGSRLMSNIREEKGYTYGISASSSGLRHGGHISISTQTANEFVAPVIDEIYKEMNILQNAPLPSEELKTVKNYMLGELARAFDGSFSMTDRYIYLLANNLPADFYIKQLDFTQTISAENIQHLACKYFNKEDFYEIVVGK